MFATGTKRAAACMLSVALAVPAWGQGLDAGSAGRTGQTLGLSYADAPGRRDQALEPDGGIFPRGGAGIGITNRPFIQEDGSRATRSGLIGTMPVAPNVDVGIGLFSVTRYSPREKPFQRIQPMRDVNERENRLAAVGMKVRF